MTVADKSKHHIVNARGCKTYRTQYVMSSTDQTPPHGLRGILEANARIVVLFIVFV